VSPDTDYQSESLINAIQDSGIEANVISRFENGNYQSIVEDQDVIFGNNFNVIDKRGYFVRVESDGGVFTP
jgi:hypothetical protein